jgi:hypothetical protein
MMRHDLAQRARYRNSGSSIADRLQKKAFHESALNTTNIRADRIARAFF